MKVVVVHNSYQQPGGEDIAFAGECRLLEQHGHTVVAYLRSNHEIDSMSTVQRLTMPKQMIYSDKSRREIQELLRKERPDIWAVICSSHPDVREAKRQRATAVMLKTMLQPHPWDW